MRRRQGKWKTRFSDRIGCRVRLDEPLSRHTTLGVGGEAELLAWLHDEEALLETRAFLDAENVNWRVLGKGSNVLVSDSGLPGAALKLSGRLAGLKLISRNRRYIVVQAGGGLALGKLLQWARANGAGGLEGLTGIPGTVGGALRLNAGTHAGAISDRLVEARLLKRGRIRWVRNDQLAFAYRRSSIGPRQVVVAARFRLMRWTRQRVEKAYRMVRSGRENQPRRVRSAGCFFRNPPGEAAGRLIDLSGAKGLRQGGAEVSRQHANYIVNSDRATAGDILRLSHRVSRLVYRTFGIRLEREVELWGRFRPVASGRRRR